GESSGGHYIYESPDYNYESSTCFEDGFESGTCSVCGQFVSRILYTSGHGYAVTVVPATCEENGYILYDCISCEYSYTEETGEIATGHAVFELDDSQDGITCTNDENYPFELVDGVYSTTNHDDGSTSTFTIAVDRDLTLLVNYRVSSESIFDKLLIGIGDRRIVETSGEVSSLVVLQLSAGDVLTICYLKDFSGSVGDDKIEFSFASVSQIDIDSIEPESCDKPITCDKCDTVLKSADHTYDSGVVFDPTCTEDGYTRYTCTVCGEYNDVAGEPSLGGHVYDSGVKFDPTCTEDGYTHYTCTVCGEYDDVAGEPSLGGHVLYNSPDYHYESPTCFEDGFESGTCSVCGQFVSIILPTSGHTYLRIYVPATCEEDGCILYDCIYCEYFYTEETGEIATGHAVFELDDSQEGITSTNDENYPFELVDGVYNSTNHDDFSTSTFTIAVDRDLTLFVNYCISSESPFDHLIIRIGDRRIIETSGEVSSLVVLQLAAGDVVTISYFHSLGWSVGNDKIEFSFARVSLIDIDSIEPESCGEPITCDKCDAVLKSADHTYEDGFDTCTNCGAPKEEE
ncbi:MAG: hypothetical protein J6Q55_04135, partial [Clostridia bacterium]|nr:hypothetical protein [Clostridia bacterium]